MSVGIPLGVLMGLVSGAAFVIFLRAALVSGEPIKAATSLLAMPVTWFGGGWLTEVFNLDQVLNSYVISLAITLVLICSFPLARIVIRIGNELGQTSP